MEAEVGDRGVEEDRWSVWSPQRPICATLRFAEPRLGSSVGRCFGGGWRLKDEKMPESDGVTCAGVIGEKVGRYKNGKVGTEAGGLRWET